MSMFFCHRCDGFRDSDDGCQEYMQALICAECAIDIAEEDSPVEGYVNAAHPLIRHDKPFTAEQQRIIDAAMAEDDGEGP